ncbi:hypothetical protein E3P99_02586 [Wallemia hederae]|uniref:FHA domain-containing protein n=1 Tax=Wallemia hederae TaxID=1540922 RepID=A0A4V4LT39_9BASI|nr:hypothetical protein E3P99_02586 [Wallemia hederae]
MAPKKAGFETIAAYAKLHFRQEHYSYYLQCLSVSIGRRCASSSSSAVPVDVDLGTSKSISRLHATINYDFERELFNLCVLSSNGLWVDGLWYGKGARIELGRRVKIQIATKVFWFVMPSEKDVVAAPAKVPKKAAGAAGTASATKQQQQQQGKNAAAAHSAKPPAQIPSNAAAHANNAIPTHPQATQHTVSNTLRPNVAYTTLISAELQDAGAKLSVAEICERLMLKYDWFAQNRDSGWQVSRECVYEGTQPINTTTQHVILLHLASGKQYHKMEDSATPLHTKWTTTSVFENSLANKTLSPRSIQLSIAANKTQSSGNNTGMVKAAKAMATQSTASVSSIAPDALVTLKIQSLKQPQMPITMNAAGTLLLHPDIFGGISKEQLQGLSITPFTNVLTFLHNTISSKAFERLSNGKGLGSGFAAIQQQQAKSSTSAARIQAQKRAEAEKERKRQAEEAAQLAQQQQNHINNLIAMLDAQGDTSADASVDAATNDETLELLNLLQQQQQQQLQQESAPSTSHAPAKRAGSASKSPKKKSRKG